jgi:hypothetical protein
LAGRGWRPGLGGVHQLGGDPAPFHRGADGGFADVGVDLTGEVGALGDGDHAYDGLAVDGEVDGEAGVAEGVDGVLDPAVHRGQNGGGVAPGGRPIRRGIYG